MRQLAYFNDRFIFLTTDGLIGSFDEHFNSMNFNWALKDVAYLLSSEWATLRKSRIHFAGPIEFSSAQRELSWNLETDLVQQNKQILFKVLIFLLLSFLIFQKNFYYLLKFRFNYFAIILVEIVQWI